MDFSLANHNEFQKYINNSHLHDNNAESFSIINNFDDLQSYLHNAKETNMLKLYSLQQRFNECLGYLQQFQQKMSNKTESQNDEKLQFQLQRYEDLLHENFKEIEWIKTERISEKNSQNYNGLFKFQKLLQKIETNYNTVQVQQEMLATQLQAAIEKQFQSFVAKIDQVTSESLKYQNDVKVLRDSFAQEYQSSLNELQSEMKELRVQLLKRIEEKILKIEENVDLLSG